MNDDGMMLLHCTFEMPKFLLFKSLPLFTSLPRSSFRLLFAHQPAGLSWSHVVCNGCGCMAVLGRASSFGLAGSL